MMFRLFIQNADKSLKWEIPDSGFTFSEELNNDRSATLNFDYQIVEAIATATGVDVDTLFTGGYRECYIYDTNNVVIYSGYLGDPTYSENESDAGTITIPSKGFWSLLDKRLSAVFVQYTSQDISYIINDLITYTQALTPGGNFGILPPAVVTTRSQTWQLRYENIKDFIAKLTNNARANAIDFEIDHTKQANIYYPSKGQQQNNIILQSGFNVTKYSIKKSSMDSIVNQVTVLGGNTDLDTQLISVQDSEDAYKTNWFLLQAKDSQVNVVDQTALDDYAKKYVTNNKAPRPIITLSHYYEAPLYTSYTLGDYLKIVLPKYNINGFYRCIKRQVDYTGLVTLSFYAF